MFVIRLEGSSCSFQINENSTEMPPFKKRKATDSRDEKEYDSKPLQALEDEESDLGADWREKCKSVASKNGYALKNNLLSDVKFIVGQSSFVCHGHRLILALGSPVFEAMFFGPLAEKEDMVIIPDVDAAGFQNLLQFVYTDTVVLKDDIEAFKTYFAADKYCISGLKRYCEDYLCSCELTPSSVWIFLENSFYLNSQAIRDRCSQVLKEDVKRALEDDSFLDANVKTIESLLSFNSLNISEFDLLKKVIEWAENKSKQENAGSLSDTLRPLLKYIRLDTLTAKDFIELRQGKLKGILTDEEALAILEYIVHPGLGVLPDWCCSTSRVPRNFLFKRPTYREVLSKLNAESEKNHPRIKPEKIHILDFDSSTTSESDDSTSDDSFSSSSSSSS